MSQDEKHAKPERNGGKSDSGEESVGSEQEAHTQSNEVPDVRQIVSELVDHIDSLREALNVSMVIVTGGYEHAFSEFRKYAKQYGIDFKEKENSRGFEAQFPVSHGRRAARLKRRVKRAAAAPELVARSFVVALVSEFDAYLGRLLKALFLQRPELLSASDRKLSVSELLEFATLDAARDFLLEKEIETVIRKSHSDQFIWMEGRFDVQLRKGLDVWPTFVELTERRNLFVHSDGSVSQQYLTVCRHHGVPEVEDLSVGDHLSVTPEYFKDAHACIYELSVKLAQVLWRKLLPDDIAAADSELIEHSYDLLVANRNTLAVKLLDFGCVTLKRHGCDQHRRMLIVNRAQACKWLGDQKKCEQILAAEDWSACGDDFLLCVHVLRGRFEDACLAMRRIGPTGPVKEPEYEDWPLFREFRESSEFLETFKDVFGKEFTNVERKLKIDQEERTQEIEKRFRLAWPEEEPTDED